MVEPKIKDEFALYFEKNTQPMVVFDSKNLSILRVNHSAVSTYGFTESEFSRLFISDLFQENYVSDFLHIIQKEPDSFSINHLKHLKKNGTLIELEQSFQKINFDDHSVYLLTENDITEQRKKERRILAHDKILSVLNESDSFSEAVPKITDAICEVGEWVIGDIWKVESSNTRLIYQGGCVNGDGGEKQFQEYSKGFSFSYGEGLPGRVWKSEKPEWIIDVAEDDNFPRLNGAVHSDIHSAFAFPIKNNNIFLGVMAFYSKERREADDNLLNMMTAFSRQIGLYLEKERNKSTVDELEGFYKVLAETASDVIISINKESKILFVNPSVKNVFGYEIDEIIGKELTVLMPDYLRKLHSAALKSYVETGIKKHSWSALELIGLHKNKSEIPLEVSFGEYKTNDKRIFTGIIREISERKKSEAELKKSLIEKEVLLREIHHRVKNNLQIISSMLSLQSYHMRDKKVLEKLLECKSRVKSIALIHEMLYQTKDFSKINFTDYITDLLSEIEKSFLGFNIKTIINIDNIFYKADKAVVLGLLINEIVTNSYKHAFAGTDNGEIHILINERPEGFHKLIIQDNGVGLPKDFDPDSSSTLGLQLVQAFVSQLNGTIEYGDENGFGTVIIYPISNDI